MIEKALRDQLKRDFKLYIERNWRVAIAYNLIFLVFWQSGKGLQRYLAKESASWRTPKFVRSFE